jgi:hypothetical protein
VSAPAIELRSVGKQYGDTVALREVSLVVGRGQVFLLTASPPFFVPFPALASASGLRSFRGHGSNELFWGLISRTSRGLEWGPPNT